MLLEATAKRKGFSGLSDLSAPRRWSWLSDRRAEAAALCGAGVPPAFYRAGGTPAPQNKQATIDLDLDNPYCKAHHTLMERELISWLRKRLPPHPLLRLGLGDDAAVLRMAGADECVVTVDMLMDHVDFELSEIDPRRAGRKALAANLSDLAAMAARPRAGVVALALPRQGGLELAKALMKACCRWPSDTAWRLPAATPTPGTDRWPPALLCWEP